MMLSLAGIPLTAGFIGKFLVVMAAVTTQHWLLAAMIVVGRYWFVPLPSCHDCDKGDQHQKYHVLMLINIGVKKVGGIMVLAAALAVLVIGIYPDPIIS